MRCATAMMRRKAVSIFFLLAQSAWFCAAGVRAETATNSSCAACVDELESHASQLAELRGRYAKLEKELEECRVVEPELEAARSRHRRALTTTPAPTPLTAVPTPFTAVLYRRFPLSPLFHFHPFFTHSRSTSTKPDGSQR